MKTTWRKSSPELIEHFLACTVNLPGAQARKMFGYPCCFIHGHMFTGLHQENWIIRLGPEEQTEFMRDYQTHIFEAIPGRPMKQYVVLPPEVLRDGALLDLWLSKSLAYAASLPEKGPKISKRKKTTK